MVHELAQTVGLGESDIDASHLELKQARVGDDAPQTLLFFWNPEKLIDIGLGFDNLVVANRNRDDVAVLNTVREHSVHDNL